MPKSGAGFPVCVLSLSACAEPPLCSLHTADLGRTHVRATLAGTLPPSIQALPSLDFRSHLAQNFRHAHRLLALRLNGGGDNARSLERTSSLGRASSECLQTPSASSRSYRTSTASRFDRVVPITACIGILIFGKVVESGMTNRIHPLDGIRPSGRTASEVGSR